MRAKAAKTGVYQYTGREVDPDNAHGLRDQAVVNVLRDEATVFDPAAVRTFIGKPITDDHPRVPVTADNWRDHGRGVVMGALRDGDHLAFDLLLMDGPTIEKVEAGKRQLSNGYTAAIEVGDFTAPDGTKCQARQARISDGNHVAIVDRARAGETCRIGDAAICDALPIALEDGAKEAAAWLKKAIALHEKHMNGSAPTTGKEGEKSQMLMMEQMKNALAELEGGGMKSGMKMDCYPFHIHDQEKPVKKILLDGLTVDIADADTAEATIRKLEGERNEARDAKAIAETSLAAKDTEIATLKTENQQLKDSKPTPAQLRDAARSFAIVCDKAKAVGVEVTDAMDEPAIMKAVVTKVMGDAAKDWNDAQIGASFAVATKDAKPAALAVQPLPAPVNIGDAAAREQASLAKANDFNGWRSAAA